MPAISDFAAFLEQVHDKLFAEFPLWQNADSSVCGRVFKNLLSSRYLPVIDAQNTVVGHAGIIDVRDSTGRPVPAEALFRLVRDDGLVRLDRFCRSLHVLNQQPSALPLFLSIHPLLPHSVSSDHGQVFEQVIRFLGISPQQIVITLPEAVVSDDILNQTVSRNYLRHGYQVAWQGTRTCTAGEDGIRPDWWIRGGDDCWHALVDADNEI